MRPWIVFVMLSCFFAVQASDRTDSLLAKLDEVLAERAVYVQKKVDRIEGLKTQLSNAHADQKFDLYARISEEYKKFVYDSASNYVRKLLDESYRSHDPSKIAYARVKLGFILASSGMFNEALDSLLTINKHGVTDSIMRDYYAILARTYFDLVDFNGDQNFTSKYTKLGIQYIDSGLMRCESNSVEYHALLAMKQVRTKSLDKAKATLEYMISTFRLPHTQFAIAASTLGHVYSLQGDIDKAVEMHIKATIADNMASTKETLAVLRLAELLYQQGDIVRAYDYVKVAMDDANFYGARHRKVQVAAIFPIIEGNRLDTVERQRKLLFGYAILLTILSVVVIGFAVIIKKQSHKIREADRSIQAANRSLHDANTLLQEVNTHLMEANKIKEEYIGYYFNINSEYLMKISAFKQAIDNKLMAKKFDDIRFVVNNINLKKEREDLYFSFDKVFLKLFPDFVETFNSFFKEEDRVILKDGQLLNTELRIFALIRMGIQDTEKIAKILDYSINTIYNYKARVKSKSTIKNEEFEARIMEIKAL